MNTNKKQTQNFINEKGDKKGTSQKSPSHLFLLGLFVSIFLFSISFVSATEPLANYQNYSFPISTLNIIFLAYMIVAIGFFAKDHHIIGLAGLFLMGLGVYTYNNGIFPYPNSDASMILISVIDLGLGLYFSFRAGLEILKGANKKKER